ncbi:MAG TPA: FHA domain-containing protein [Rhodanobacteraceae bacterium]
MHVGSAPDDAVVLTGAGVGPHHLTLLADARGLVLTVRPGCQRVYVNARAVREKALLHFGDTVTLGASKFLVTSDAPPQPEAETAAQVASFGQVALRVVSGSASGQALAVAPQASLGMGSRHFGDVPYACRVAQVDGAVVFEADSAAPRINGWRCSRARLAHDDQIVLGEHRLLVEAPVLQHAARVIEPPPPVAALPEPVQDDSPHAEVWWLIAAAAVLAALIALFLYFRW